MTNNISRKQQVHGLLSPSNCTLLLIDYQPQMFFPVRNIDGQTLINNAVGLAKAAKVFNIPTILTTVSAETFSGPMIEQLQKVFPNQKPIDRTTMNAWEDPKVVAEVKKAGRNKLVMGGLWTAICIDLPVISAIEDGYEVYVVADACGDVTEMAQELAMERAFQSGAVPITWLQFLLELQRDWARQDTYDAVLKVVGEHAGAYGLGVSYAAAMLGGPKRKAA